MCFPGCPNFPSISCTFTRTTETTKNQKENNQDNGSTASAPVVVTKQPSPSTVSTTEVKFLLNQTEDSGVLETAERIQRLVEDSQRVIHNPQIQQGCLVCYDQCAPRCDHRCGCFGHWICACFKACCILETPMKTNIPDVMQQMDKLHGPLSLAMALHELQWNITDMAVNNCHISQEEEECLEETCRRAKKKLSGSFIHLSQQYFYDTTNALPEDKLTESILPVILKIMREKSWKQPLYQKVPLKCWILEPTSDVNLPQSRLSLDRSSLSPSTEKSMYTNPTRAIAIRYDKKKMTKFLSNLEVLSLESGATGKLGAKEAHLVVTIFDVLRIMSAGEDSPLTKTGGSLSYEMDLFIKLFMLILTACGYVPLDEQGKTNVQYDDKNNNLVSIYQLAMSNYNQPGDTESTQPPQPLATTEKYSSYESLGARPKTEKSVAFSSIVSVGYTSSSLTSQSSIPPSPHSPKRGPLVRQNSVRTRSTPSDDYRPPNDEEWLLAMINGNDDSSDDEEDVARQRQLLNSSHNLGKLFAAMKKDYGDV
ncbi:hypothetical protein [Chlamydia felis Fe/C-56]|uniref:Uncharacterized protein n=1 Tax=Chlamydia felis (strain Fe/C-56) TaxID=264202 RepID=Q253R1_CHLFF|nr:hypothetical protein [Chlamydia felis]BAE81477.1 hypothetical protein [Chlamydia felis Fe/C-56]